MYISVVIYLLCLCYAYVIVMSCQWMCNYRRYFFMYDICTGVGSGGGGGGARLACAPPHFFDWGGNGMFVPPPPLLTPHFYFPLELYVYITLTNNYLAFFIYQLIILWTISINWHRWLLLNNHTSKYNSFILVLYRRYKNHVSVCPPPLFGTLLRHWYVHDMYMTMLCIIMCVYMTCLCKIYIRAMSISCMYFMSCLW